MCVTSGNPPYEPDSRRTCRPPARQMLDLDRFDADLHHPIAAVDDIIGPTMKDPHAVGQDGDEPRAERGVDKADEPQGGGSRVRAPAWCRADCHWRGRQPGQRRVQLHVSHGTGPGSPAGGAESERVPSLTGLGRP